MMFLLGSRRMLAIDRNGIRMHKAPRGQHFEPAIIRPDTKEHKVMLLKPDAMSQTPQEISKQFQEAVAQQAVNDALTFHRDRTEELLKRVLNAPTASDAAQMVATELEVTEERIVERSKQQ